MMAGQTTLSVARAGVTVLEGISAQIDPIDPRPFEVQQFPENAAGDTPFDKYAIYPIAPPSPDIRPRDQLVDTGETDTFTQQAARYYVRRVKRYAGSHIEVECDRVASSPTT